MDVRQEIGTILIMLAVVYTIYLSVIMIRRINSVVLKADYTRIFCCELAACAFFVLFALDVRFGFTGAENVLLKIAGWCLRIIVVLVTAVLLFFMGKITVGSFICTEAPAKNAIVLGLALENGKPVDDLISRLDTAGKFLQRNPDATLVLTGGNSDGSGRTEAAVMRDILAERGVKEDRMRLEDRAETTKDNFRNTARMICPDDPVVLISSNYHMDRAVRTARGAGFSRILRLPAPSSLITFGANVMWEVILELNELLFGQ